MSQVVTEEVPAGTDVSGSSIAQLQGMLRGGEKATLPEEQETTPETAPKPAKAGAADETAPPAGAEKTNQETEEKPQTGINKRFSQLTGEIRDLKAQLANRPAAAAEAKPGVAIPPAINASEPVAANYETYDAYVKDLTKWTVAQTNRESETKAASKTMEASWEARKAEARTRIDDFDEFAGADIPISQVMNAAILESDSGADIAYFLGKNPEEAARIAKLPPVSAAVAIGKIEASLAKATTPEKPKPAAVKLPPKPPATVTAGSTPAPSNDLNDPKTSFETFINVARKNLRRPSF